MKKFIVLLIIFLCGTALISKQPPSYGQRETKDFRQIITDTENIPLDSIKKQIDTEIDSIAIAINKKREYEKRIFFLKKENMTLKKELEDYKKMVEFLSPK